MKLSVRGEYALRAMLALGIHDPTREWIRIQTISDEQKIPKRFLEQILNDLRRAGVVESQRGVAGGYRLAMPPEEIPLSRLIRHVDGALAPVSCVSERYYEKCSCPDESRCAIRSVMKDVRDAIVAIMDHFSLADLCKRAERLKSEPLNPLDFVI